MQKGKESGYRSLINGSYNCSYSDLESRMKDELMNVKIKFTEQSQTVAELRQEISRLETKVSG